MKISGPKLGVLILTAGLISIGFLIGMFTLGMIIAKRIWS